MPFYARRAALVVMSSAALVGGQDVAPSSITAITWKEAPVVIGGTGGSGTRGVVAVLSKLGIYLSPPPSSAIFRECFNGEQLDNG